MLHPAIEVHCGPSHVSKMDPFARIVNGFDLTLQTIYTKSFIVDV